MSPVKVLKGDKETKISVLLGKAEIAGTVHPATEEAQGNLIHVYKYLMGVVKKMEPQLRPVAESKILDRKLNT